MILCRHDKVQTGVGRIKIIQKVQTGVGRIKIIQVEFSRTEIIFELVDSVFRIAPATLQFPYQLSGIADVYSSEFASQFIMALVRFQTISAICISVLSDESGVP